MTDTTDIKALRDAVESAADCGYVHPVYVDGRYLESLLDVLEAERQRADAAQTLLMPEGLHENTKALVIGFANALAVKLHKAEKKYGYDNSWKNDNWQRECQRDLLAHVTKGDPLDVAAYCAFMWHHGWPTAPKPSVKGE
ncbi:hypothetical protein FS594_15810 [Rahnella aquatilis]|nr:hypothetical protein FS594_15810 [Rahnella aquatilis]